MADPNVVDFASRLQSRLSEQADFDAHMGRLTGALSVMVEAIQRLRALGCTKEEIISTLTTAAEEIRQSE